MSDVDLFGPVGFPLDADVQMAPTVDSYDPNEIPVYHFDEEAVHRKIVEEYFEDHTDPLYLPPERKTSTGPCRRRKEWEEFGDPRCFEGHFRPKINLGKFLQANDSWSQRRLAEEMGTDEGTVSNWISGKRYLSDKKLVQIAHVTGLSIPHLLDLRHVETDIDWLIDQYEFYKGDEDSHIELGKAFAPREVSGFAEDLYYMRFMLNDYVAEGNRESIYAEALETQAEEWYDEDGDFIEDVYECHDKMRAWIIWFLYGDARNPLHLQEALHSFVINLPDEFDEDRFYVAPNKVRTAAFESLADVLQSAANMNRM